MLRYTWFLQAISGTWLVLICGYGSAFADGGLPVPFYKEVFASTSVWDFVFGFYYGILLKVLFLTIITEYCALYFLLGRPARARIRLLLYVILINVITNPAAQFAMLFLADPLLLGSPALALLVLCLIELVVVLVEFGFMRLIFRRMYRRTVLDEPVSAERTIMIALVANVASCAIVLIGFILMIQLSIK